MVTGFAFSGGKDKGAFDELAGADFEGAGVVDSGEGIGVGSVVIPGEAAGAGVGVTLLSLVE